MSLDLYISNDNRLKLVGLKDADDAYQNSATVTVTLKDANDTDIAGETWPLTLDYVAASNGDYQTVLQDTLSGLTNEDALVAHIDVDSGGLTAHWEIPITAKTRDS